MAVNKKSPKMKKAEDKLMDKLEEVIPEYVNRYGMTGASKMIGVSKSTLNYWMLKFGIEYRRIALRPGQDVRIIDKPTNGPDDKGLANAGVES